MALDPITELEALIDALAVASIDVALCGGLALAVHGYPRNTIDIDLLIPGASVAAAIAVAKQCGFDLPARKMTLGLKAGRPQEIHRVSKLEAETGALLALDLIVVSPALEPVWASRTTVRAGTRTLVVVSREGLATMKRIAGRPQDLADLANLEGTDGSDDQT